VSLLNEFVSANCSVNLSVSTDEGDDHDDEQRSATAWILAKLLVGEVTTAEAT
jgi:hypothetical protein